MLYAIFCYNQEDVVGAWTAEHDAAVMARIGAVIDPLASQGKLGPVARLLPTTAAITLRGDHGKAVVLDGPFAETKEQLLGFYILDVASLDDALAIVGELAKANPGGGYEIRPIGYFRAGGAVA